MRHLMATTALLFALTAPVQAGYDEALAAYQRGDYATALREFRPLAEQGNLYAQNNLGVMYAQGLGVPQDFAAAAKWFRRAAQQGEAYAQNNLGYLYAEGLGVEQDYVQAYVWFSLAGETSNRERAASQMTAAEIAEAERLLENWVPRRE